MKCPHKGVVIPLVHSPQRVLAPLQVSASATPHDEAHDAFMTLPPYSRSKEGEALSWRVARNSAGWAFK